MLFKRIALGRIHCFCLSQAARDVQQVQETPNSPHCANGLVSRSKVKEVWLREATNGIQVADYLPHVTRGGFDSKQDTQISTKAQRDE